MPVFPLQHFKRLVDLAKRGRIAPVYLMLGPQEEVKEKARRLVKVFSESGIFVEFVDLVKEPVERLSTALKEVSLFGPKKVVVVEGAEALSEREDASRELLSLLESVPVHLVLLCQDFSESSQIYAFALEKGAIVPVGAHKAVYRLLSELPEVLSAEGKRMERSTAEYFVSLVGENYLKFLNELEKLILFVGEREVITKEDVDQVVSPEEEVALFSIGDVLLEKGPEAARYFLLRLLETGEHHLKVLGALYSFFKRLWLIHFLAERHPELRTENRFERFKTLYENILKETWERPPSILSKLHPYAAFRLKKHLKRTNEKFFKGVFHGLWRLDMALKKEFRAPIKAFYEFFILVSNS